MCKVISLSDYKKKAKQSDVFSDLIVIKEFVSIYEAMLLHKEEFTEEALVEAMFSKHACIRMLLQAAKEIQNMEDVIEMKV